MDTLDLRTLMHDLTITVTENKPTKDNPTYSKAYIDAFARLSMLKYEISKARAEDKDLQPIIEEVQQKELELSPNAKGKNPLLDGDAEITGLRQLQKAYSQYLKEYDNLEDKQNVPEELQAILVAYSESLSRAIGDSHYLSYEELTKLIAEKEKEMKLSLDEARAKDYDPKQIENDMRSFYQLKNLENQRRALREKEKEIREALAKEPNSPELQKALADVKVQLVSMPTFAQIKLERAQLRSQYGLYNSASLKRLLEEKCLEYNISLSTPPKAEEKTAEKEPVKPTEPTKPTEPAIAVDSKEPATSSSRSESTTFSPASITSVESTTPVAPVSDKYFVSANSIVGKKPVEYFKDKGLEAHVEGTKMSYISTEYNADGSVKGYRFLEDQPIEGYLKDPIKSYKKMIQESMKNVELWEHAGYNTRGSRRQIQKRLMEDFKKDFKEGDNNRLQYDKCLEKLLAMRTAVTPKDLNIAIKGEPVENPRKFYPGTLDQYHAARIEKDKEKRVPRYIFSTKLSYAWKFNLGLPPTNDERVDKLSHYKDRDGKTHERHFRNPDHAVQKYKDKDDEREP